MNDSDKEFWDDLEAILGINSRMQGDIDADQIMKEKGISREAARSLMKKMAATGKYSYQIVVDPNVQNGRRAILRKIIKP